ncbi:RNA pyrophosphohydrolase [Brytella acorum]|uniref:RNA pyrophosphohydrolase n=1 Tax=Brytella acorum TaxID=2959299 RepID=A0AA35UHZ4_9PROT|nr:RNA pyrophosphohydrolase [Brytella acorum]MDF3623452.1 RNA pyrophosphohydrolase [Brytella acorum]CAI9120559.1 RNA pyrophosphohydrolase [Brytella acorum]
MTDPRSLPYRRNVGAMLFNARGDLFLARRSDMAEGIWQCPQGGIDDGEDPDRAIMRELGEEIGTANAVVLGVYPEWISYDLPDHLIGKALGGRYRGQTQRWYALRFLGTDRDIRLDQHLPAEFDRWQWVLPTDVPDFNLGFKKPIYETLLPALSALAPPL